MVKQAGSGLKEVKDRWDPSEGRGAELFDSRESQVDDFFERFRREYLVQAVDARYTLKWN